MPEENVFTGKIAGQPAWVWVGGGAVLVGGFLWWRKRQAAQAAASSSTGPAAYTSSAVPTAATSEELMAAGLYQPPNITYNVPSPNIDNGVQVAAPTQPSPTQPPPPVLDFTRFGPAGDVLAQELGVTSATTDLSGLQYWSGIFNNDYANKQSQHDPNAYQDALSDTLAYAHNAAVQQHNTSIPVYSYGSPAAAASKSVPTGATPGAQTLTLGSGAARRRTPGATTAAARTGLAPTRSWARSNRLDVFSPLFPNRGYRVA